MKRLIQTTLAALLVIGLSSITFAQNNTDNDNISSTANVVAAITVNGSTDLNFGDLQQGQETTVSANESEGGKFTVDATDNANVTISLTYPTITGDVTGLTADNNDDELGVTFEAAYDSNNGATTPSNNLNDTFANDGSATDEITVDFNGGGSGLLGIWIGGSTTPAADQLPGAYSGTITLTATYN